MSKKHAHTEVAATHTNEEAVHQAEVVATETKQTLVAAIFDVGTAWAEFGLNYGKFALESSAKALTRTATALDDLKGKLRKTEKEHTAA